MEHTMRRMIETPLLRRLLVGCVVLCASQGAAAEVFTNKREADHFEAIVTPDRLVVRERYRGATTIYGDLACPLGPAVKATILPPGTDGRLCFQFLKDKCEYTRFQDGEPIHKEELASPQPRMCIALANADEAKRLAALVNVGPRPQEQPGIGSTGSPATYAAPVGAAGSVSTTKSEPTIAPEPQQSRSVAPASASPPPPSKSVVLPGNTVTHGHAASGKWVTESFVVGPAGNRRMTERTYAAAYILDDKPGRPPGRYLLIRNKSNKHLLFYGLGGGAQSKLEPGGEALVNLSYGPAAQAQLNQTVTLLWFDRN
jgi:hypothetical protein